MNDVLRVIAYERSACGDERTARVREPSLEVGLSGAQPFEIDRSHLIVCSHTITMLGAPVSLRTGRGILNREVARLSFSNRRH